MSKMGVTVTRFRNSDCVAVTFGGDESGFLLDADTASSLHHQLSRIFSAETEAEPQTGSPSTIKEFEVQSQSGTFYYKIRVTPWENRQALLTTNETYVPRHVCRRGDLAVTCNCLAFFYKPADYIEGAFVCDPCKHINAAIDK